MAKPLSFKDFIVVDYRPGMGELINYRATKRRRLGEEPEVSEEETTDEALDFQARRARARSMKKNKAKIAMGQRRARKRAANPERLKKRASKSARSQLFKKFSKGILSLGFEFKRPTPLSKPVQTCASFNTPLLLKNKPSVA